MKRIIPFISICLISFVVCMGNLALAQPNEWNYAYQGHYNASAAIDYARRWTDNSGGYSNASYNPAYTDYASGHNDCSNFVSQCLEAGGLIQDAEWNTGTSNWTTTWLRAYLTTGYGNGTTGLGYQMIQRAAISEMSPGDILFLDSNNDGSCEHVVIISEVSNGEVYICGHTSNRRDYPYSGSLGTSKYWKNWYLVKMNGSINPDCDEWHNVIAYDGEMTVRATPNGTDTGRRAYASNNPHHIIKKTTVNVLEWGYVEGLDGWIALGNDYTQVVLIPGKPAINVAAGDELHEVILSCGATGNTEWYDYRVYDMSDNCIWARGAFRGTQYAVLLPAGTYKADIASVNGEYGTYTFSDKVTFTVSGANIYDMGVLRGRKIYNGHTYELYEKSVTWLQAKRLAAQNGGYLVTITSQEEQNVSQSLNNVFDGLKWIGATSYPANYMTWDNGETMSYSNWATGEPNNSGGIEHCAHMYTDGTWNDVRNNLSDQVKGYIVEYDKVYGEEMSFGYDRILPDGDYVIAAAADANYYLDIVGGKQQADDETNVALWTTSFGVDDWDAWTIQYNASDKFYTIKQKGTNMALDVQSGSAAEGKNVQVYTGSDGNSAQKWAISLNGDRGYRIQAKCSGLSLDIEGGKFELSTNVEQWSANDSNAQRWVFIPYKPVQTLSEGRYILVSALDESVELDVSGDSGDIPNETNVAVWSDSCLSQYNSFDVTALPNGYYTLTHASSGKVLTVVGGGTASATNIAVCDYDGSPAQQWAITEDGDEGGYILRVRSSGYAMDVTDGKTTNGTNVRQVRYNGTKAQTWDFVRAEYKVSYNVPDGITAPEEQIKYYKAKLKLSSEIPYRSGYQFLGWGTSADATAPSYMPGDIYTKDGELQLYAIWEKITSMDEPDLILPAALKAIDEEAFEGITAEVVKCPEGLKSIGNRAFADCASLRQIYIPASCTSISKTAFSGCDSKLVIFCEEDSVAEMYAEAYGYMFVIVNSI